MKPRMPGLRILIVEDEPLIAMMLEDFVDALGHVPAGTADCIATAQPLVELGAFDLAILDVNLRGGERIWSLADRVKAAGKPYVIASGGQTDPFPDAHLDAPLLAKPYTIDGVKAAIDGLV
jgi:DNA-binding response OmpR family regulator